jgi:hypothetical protein
MNFKLKFVAAGMLAASLVASSAYAGQTTPPAKKKHTAKTTKSTTAVTKVYMAPPPAPSAAHVEAQIQALRTELQSQIDSLKGDLAAKDEQLRQAQAAAATAQAAAARAQAAASTQQQAVSDNAAAVSTLQATVTDLKGNQTSLATSVSDAVAAANKVKKDLESPDALHYKGITITPGGFAAAETVYRTKATGGDIPTAFSSIPYEGADAYLLSEFYGSARQSRVSLLAEGKTSWGTLRGYYEADWLGTGTSSNNNQSNSYVLRQRVIYAQAETNSHLAFSGGQMWSLATEGIKGISAASSNTPTPLTIDPNYVTGFVWARQYGFRVTKNWDHAAFGISAENPQLLYTASLAGNTPYAVLGSAGQNGGAYNATVSASVPTTYIQTYGNQKQTDSTGGVLDVAVPQYNTIYANTNISNYSFNVAPDIIAKFTLDPGWGHYEILGIAGFAHETVYPGVTTNSTKFGGLKDIATGTAIVPTSTTAGWIPDSIVVGGIGGSVRFPIVPKVVTVGGKALYGPGVGRYGDSTLADVTVNSWGGLSPIHNVSGLATIEITPNPRLTIYGNYGGDYAGRDDWGAAGVSTSLGSPSADFCPSTAGAFACTTTPTAAQVAAGGTWGPHWGAPSNAAVGYGSRLLTASPACGVLQNPGYNGSSTGYYATGGCGAQTRDVQEITGGYWYDIYKGEHGRLRQGIQYGYAVREGWDSNTILGAKGIDNMFWTTFRYYLP